jgi:hypothetical protein
MKKISFPLLGVIFIFIEIAQMNPAWANIGQPSMTQGASQGRQSTLKELPLPAQEAVSAALGQEDRTYHIFEGRKGVEAQNAAQGLAMDFNRGTVLFRAGENDWGLRLEGMGREDYTPLPEAKPVRKANRLEYVRGPVREWYLNGPLGLEQGFTVSTRPWGKSHIPFVLELTMSGDLRAWVDQDQRGLSLTKGDGSKVLTYGGLRAYDAAGKELLTWLEVKGSQLWVKIKDDLATYPVTIDPLVQQQELTASDGAANDYFGRSASLSSDGNTALIGTSYKTISGKTGQGAAYVFTKRQALPFLMLLLD